MGKSKGEDIDGERSRRCVYPLGTLEVRKERGGVKRLLVKERKSKEE